MLLLLVLEVLELLQLLISQLVIVIVKQRRRSSAIYTTEYDLHRAPFFEPSHTRRLTNPKIGY